MMFADNMAGATDVIANRLLKLAKERNDLLIDLLATRSTILEDEEGHTDDVLVRLAQRLGAPVLTVDKVLKRRLAAAGCAYLEVVRDRSLRLVD